jgi:hypothetical protein
MSLVRVPDEGSGFVQLRILDVVSCVRRLVVWYVRRCESAYCEHVFACREPKEPVVAYQSTLRACCD